MKKLEFFRCNVCGNICVKLHDSGVPVFCCGAPMQKIEPNTVDAASEKHKPVVKIKSERVDVQVGSVLHPMSEEHYITMIVLETNNGFSVKYLAPTDAPQASFMLLGGESVKSVYAYCNLHGLWK